MKKKRILFEENSRVMYETDDESRSIMEYTDTLTDSDGKQVTVPGVAVFTKAFAENLYQYLEEYYLCTHFSDSISATELVVETNTPVLLDVLIHNKMTTELAERFQLDETMTLHSPLIELFWNDKLISPRHADAFGIISSDERRFMERTLSKVNAVLKSYFAHRDYRLFQLRLNLGYSSGTLVLTGNFTLDSLVFQSLNNGEIIDAARLIRDEKKARKRLADLTAHFLQ